MTTATETPAPVKPARKPRQVKPVSGSVRWLKRLVLPLGIGRLEIVNANGVAEQYDVGAHLDTDDRVVGFRMVKDDDEGYDLFTDSARWTCSCPHFEFHGHQDRKGCKHAAGLRAALQAIGQLPPAPAAPASVVAAPAVTWDSF
jgi:hypothetical protein